MRIGLIADLHLGGAGGGSWHNRLYYQGAAEVLAATVALLNQQRLDLVLVLGDLADQGRPADLAVTRSWLDQLSVAWYVVPGNHDRPALRTGDFDHRLQPHAGAGYRDLGDGGLLLLREDSLGPLDAPSLGAEAATTAWEQVAAAAPRSLVVACHFPLVSEQEVAMAHQGKYAGHLAGGEALLVRLATVVRGPIVVLCGHNHWHRVTRTSWGAQVATAALIEWPMEGRVVELLPDRLLVQTLPTAVPAAAAWSLEGAPWPAGAAGDREAVVPLP